MGSYEQAAAVLDQVGQIAMSDSSLWRQVAQWGEQFAGLEAQQREQASLLPLGHERPEQRRTGTYRLGAAIDGTMIHIRAEGWKELKVGCVFDIEPQEVWDELTQEQVEIGHAVHPSYVAHLGGPTVFGQAVWAEAKRRGWEQAADTQILGDGAVWIWKLAAEHFYDSYQTVDWYHATEHLATAATVLYGEGPPQAEQWHRRQETVLFQGQAERVAQDLLTAAGTAGAAQAEALQREAGYFLTNHRRMNYLELRTDGYLIGSGSVESGGKQFKARLAGPGMRWSRSGAEHLIPIRSAVLSERFEAVWQAAYTNDLSHRAVQAAA